MKFTQKYLFPAISLFVLGSIPCINSENNIQNYYVGQAEINTKKTLELLGKANALITSDAAKKVLQWTNLTASGLLRRQLSSYENIDGLVLELLIKTIVYEKHSKNIPCPFKEISVNSHHNYFVSPHHPGILFNEHISKFNHSMPAFNDYPRNGVEIQNLIPLSLTIEQRLELIDSELNTLQTTSILLNNHV